VLAVLVVVSRRRLLHAGLVTLGVASLVATAAVIVARGQALPSLAALFAFALLTVSLLRSSPGRIAAGLGLLATAAVASEALRLNQTLAASAVVVCEACFLVAVAAGLYLRWSDWRRLVGEESARTEERLEIARELHDLVGHYVTGIVVQAQAAQHVAASNPTAAVDALARIEEAGAGAMSAMRRMVGGLRDDLSVPPGAWWADIESLVAGAATDGVPVRLRLDPEVSGASADLSASAHRIVTEALTNVRRHAVDVTQVDVELDVEADGGRLVIVIADDGAASAVPTHDTYGLVGMRERAEALGGTLFAGPRPSGQGWTVRAEIPLVAR
jgi:signal transduction histidine kinase